MENQNGKQNICGCTRVSSKSVSSVASLNLCRDAFVCLFFRTCPAFWFYRTSARYHITSAIFVFSFGCFGCWVDRACMDTEDLRWVLATRYQFLNDNKDKSNRSLLKLSSNYLQQYERTDPPHQWCRWFETWLIHYLLKKSNRSYRISSMYNHYKWPF